jgi:hypothetical protein
MWKKVEGLRLRVDELWVAGFLGVAYTIILRNKTTYRLTFFIKHLSVPAFASRQVLGKKRKFDLVLSSENL